MKVRISGNDDGTIDMKDTAFPPRARLTGYTPDEARREIANFRESGVEIEITRSAKRLLGEV